MRNYIRCCIANRATFAGFAALPIAALSLLMYVVTGCEILAWLGGCTAYAAALALLLTGLGLDTLCTYRRVLRIALAERRINPIWRSHGKYCNRVGAILALRDAARFLQKGAGT